MGRWWAHHSSISPDGWSLVVDKVVKASWDTPSEISLDEVVTILPRSRKGVIENEDFCCDNNITVHASFL